MYPGQAAIVHREAQGFTPPQTNNLVGVGNDTFNLIDREIGGQRGRIDIVPYTEGVVSSDAVENFELDGRQAIIRRKRNPSDEGPVGTSDSNGMLALRYAQAVNQYYPSEYSQADLVRAL
jgi:hypothetical protein